MIDFRQETDMDQAGREIFFVFGVKDTIKIMGVFGLVELLKVKYFVVFNKNPRRRAAGYLRFLFEIQSNNVGCSSFLIFCSRL
jgi:hypothetical protein